MSRPIFFDPTGRRRRQGRRGVAFGLLMVLFSALIFAFTLARVPSTTPIEFKTERGAARPAPAHSGKLNSKLGRLFGHQHGTTAATRAGHPQITLGFYATWTQEGAASLEAHIGQLDWVAPTLLSLDPKGELAATDDQRLRRILAASSHHPEVMPVLQNATNGKWNGDQAAALMHDPAWRARLIAGVSAWLDKTGDAGIMYDLENLPPSAQPDLLKLLAETTAAFAPRQRMVAVTMPIDDPVWSAKALAKVTDRVVLMAYDEHFLEGSAGPIASNSWFYDHMRETMAGVSPDEVIVALGSYGYDWHDKTADNMTVEEAWLAAHDSGTVPVFDRVSGNPGFSYEENNSTHEIWLLDAAASWNQMQILRQMGLNDVALWRLGSEDPGFWQALHGWHQHAAAPDLATIAQDLNVDVEGSGEILRIGAVPTPGHRTITSDAATGAITSETYTQLPTPYVVERTGALPKQIALTFDDGPDGQWTPQILDILDRYHVPATFFVIGENAVTHPALMNRLTNSGYEIGNHSFTHPNLATLPLRGAALELNATQRLIEAYTGRSTRLFRAPYFGDAEPTTADELGPALLAQQQGYIIAGLHVDPGDWKRPGVDVIVNETVAQIEGATPEHSGNVVLLHDSGGIRDQTVAALPRIIERLRADGYRFVPVSALAGLTHDAAMPEIKGVDLIMVRADIGVFLALGGLMVALKWVFLFAIALGMARAIGMTLLARFMPLDTAPEMATSEHPLVSVIIPAYNEERVIESSVRRILESDYPQIEVIVADDGSADQTSAIVAAAFAHEPRVRLMTMVNGGKASALNRALKAASGSVVVALDADTQFEPQTIGLLVRWFADPEIGAVAGNAKVGNRVNLVTRWQAIEYVTAQNLERRALTGLDAIMVVPGAVGAWRREALEQVGGYPEDTLAEDQDLTIAIQRRGWAIAYDEGAVAWTEAPETFGALAKQRFRWSFGTLQCLWKHRSVLRRRDPAGLAYIGMPQAWMFQIVFAMISPLIDLALLVSIFGTVLRVMQHGWAQTQTDVLEMLGFWVVFTAVDLICGWTAFRHDVREKRFPAFLLLAQRFIYRQLMYWVVIRAVVAAVTGRGIGWGKLQRTGNVSTLPAPAGVPPA